MAKRERIAQTPKDRLNSRARAEVDRSRSNAAGPHRLGTDYKRKPKHVNRQDY